MLPPSKNDADALRHWLNVTVAAYADDGIGMSLPPKPLGLMVLVCLWLDARDNVRYSDLRVTLRLEEATLGKSLANAVDLLARKGLVAKLKGRDDGREREVRLDSKGRDVIGRLIQARLPQPK